MLSLTLLCLCSSANAQQTTAQVLISGFTPVALSHIRGLLYAYKRSRTVMSHRLHHRLPTVGKHNKDINIRLLKTKPPVP